MARTPKPLRVVDGYTIAPKRVGTGGHTSVGTSYLFDDRVYRVVREGRVRTVNTFGNYRLLTLRAADGHQIEVADSVLCRKGYRAGGVFDLGIVYVTAQQSVVLACGCELSPLPYDAPRIGMTRGELLAACHEVCKDHRAVVEHAVLRSCEWDGVEAITDDVRAAVRAWVETGVV